MSVENKKIIFYFLITLVLFLVPITNQNIQKAVVESFLTVVEYVKAHILFCLIPAFFIAGAIMVFLNQETILKYLGPNSNKIVSYSIAAVSGSILSVCSCTVLPIFKGIYKKGAGLGPAISFLYSGPAINILAIILSFKVLGFKIGLARMFFAIFLSLIIGIFMQMIFKKDDEARNLDQDIFKSLSNNRQSNTGKQVIFIALMILFLIFLNWTNSNGNVKLWDLIYRSKWIISSVLFLIIIILAISWFKRERINEWFVATRDFALQILPLLFVGIIISGFLFGRNGSQALISNKWISSIVGGNSLQANLISSISGTLMYFATLTEIPILQGLLSNGMGQGPALALLLAGPSVSLPSILIIWGELGAKKTICYVLFVILFSALAGWLFGFII
ncbi:MAG: permease [Spirochaetes bacterium]|nr:permease [Spirochaetota bacterium]MBP8991234.1 permease [Spirochaetota bacterium]